MHKIAALSLVILFSLSTSLFANNRDNSKPSDSTPPPAVEESSVRTPTRSIDNADNWSKIKSLFL